MCGSSLPEPGPPRHDLPPPPRPSCRAGFGRPRPQVAAEGVGEVRPQIPFARGGALANLLGLDPEPLQQLGRMPRGQKPDNGVLGPGPLLEPGQVTNDGGRGELVGSGSGEEVLQISE